jgi:hypothetical protein
MPELKNDTFLPAAEFDTLFARLPVTAREAVKVGEAVCGVVFRNSENELVRIYRGDPKNWGIVQRRMAFGDFDPLEKSDLGNGRLGEMAAAEIRAEKLPPITTDFRTYDAPVSPCPPAVDVVPVREVRKQFEAVVNKQRAPKRRDRVGGHSKNARGRKKK